MPFVLHNYKHLKENGSIWIISADLRNGQKFVPISLLATECAQKFDLRNYNSIVWINEKTIGNGLFSNIYSNVQMFSKTSDYFFDKDPVREKHIWKDIEWGKRKYRYNKKGKDPGNVWINNVDDGKGKIISHSPGVAG